MYNVIIFKASSYGIEPAELGKDAGHTKFARLPTLFVGGLPVHCALYL